MFDDKLLLFKEEEEEKREDNGRERSTEPLQFHVSGLILGSGQVSLDFYTIFQCVYGFSTCSLV